MSRREDIPLPVPAESEQDLPIVSAPDPDAALPAPENLIEGPEEWALDVLLWGPATVPFSVFAYGLDGERGLSNIEGVIRDRARMLKTNRISKYDAYYFPQTPAPPGAWEYKCETCRFYQPESRDSGDGGKCAVVGHEEDIFGGRRVHPEAWCSLWLPKEGRGWLRYLSDRIVGGDPESHR